HHRSVGRTFLRAALRYCRRCTGRRQSFFFFKQKTAYEIGLGIPAEPLFRSRLRLGKVTVADVLAAQPVTTNLLKFMRASIKMIGVSNLQSFIASMTQKLTLSDISDESKNYLDKA